MKIIIKLPVGEKGKFKLQSWGNIPGRQYKTAAGVLEAIESVFLRTGLKEKTSIVIKDYIHTSFVNINESLPSTNSDYLLYCTTCFLEDYLSKESLANAEKRWTKWVMTGGPE